MNLPETSPSLTADDRLHDLVVIGSGFGGLATALRAAEKGASVLVLESVGYPGGCASTFERGGLRYESGATLFSGLGERGLFGRWKERHGSSWEVDWIDPVVTLRAPGLDLPISRDRERFLGTLCALPGAPVEEVRRFFRTQARVADPIWRALEHPGALPPWRLRDLGIAISRAPGYLPVLPLITRPLARVLRDHGVADFEPLRILTDAMSQITVQCSATEAEAAFALGTLDYYFRDTGHVVGGIGALAQGMVEAIEQLGGEVRFLTRAKSIESRSDAVLVHTKRATFRTRQVVANLTPGDCASLLGEEDLPRRWSASAREVDDAWGACMLYLTVPADSTPEPEAHHLQIVQDPGAPFEEGNHLFCSIGDAQEAPDGPPVRTVTVSTHVALREIASRSREEQGRFVQEIQDRMAAGVRTHASDWLGSIEHVMPGSPRTFRRFTGRRAGAVGGIPKRAGWRAWDFRPLPPLAQGRVHLVGDSVFPGQSTLAVALGGVKLADRIL